MKMNNKKKSFALVASLALIVLVIVGGTVAYLVDKTDPVENTFVPTEITSEVGEDPFGGTTKTNVTIKNTSEDVSAFIRAAVIVNWKDADGNLKRAEPNVDYTITYGDSTDGWVEWKKDAGGDGYFYYTSAVLPQDSTNALIEICKPVEEKAPEGYYLDVVILGSAIQSEPIDAVTEAWGVDPSTLG